MREKGSSPIGVGVLTVLTVLLVLILAVFSALTYTSVRADLALSRTNADTVSAYYAADSEAAGLLDAFRRDTDPELEATLPMTQSQSLYIHLLREEDGAVSILAWEVVPAGRRERIWRGSICLFSTAPCRARRRRVCYVPQRNPP